MSNKQQQSSGGFLSGNGEIPKGLVINKSMLINPEQKNSLLSKLDMFLPQMQQANQNLPAAATESSAVQIFFDHGDDDDEEEEEVDERTVEMNISMFPMEDDDDDDEEEEVEKDIKAIKRVQEMD